MTENKNTKPKRAYHKTSETQKLIFQKAMALMSEKGYQGTTVREICTALGIPVGTFYNCYKSKMDILEDVYDEGDAYFEEIEAELKGKDAITQLHIFTRSYARLNIKTGIDVMRVLFYPTNEWFARRRPMQELMLKILEDGRASGELREDIDAEKTLDTIFDVFRGTCYNWCIFDGEFDLTERLDAHMDLLCMALKKE